VDKQYITNGRMEMRVDRTYGAGNRNHRGVFGQKVKVSIGDTRVLKRKKGPNGETLFAIDAKSCGNKTTFYFFLGSDGRVEYYKSSEPQDGKRRVSLPSCQFSRLRRMVRQYVALNVLPVVDSQAGRVDLYG